MTLLDKVREFMNDNQPHTLAEISDAAQASEASVSARIRDLRKQANGSRTVNREKRDGKWFYTLVSNA